MQEWKENGEREGRTEVTISTPSFRFTSMSRVRSPSTQIAQLQLRFLLMRSHFSLQPFVFPLGQSQIHCQISACTGQSQIHGHSPYATA